MHALACRRRSASCWRAHELNVCESLSDGRRALLPVPADSGSGGCDQNSDRLVPKATCGCWSCFSACGGRERPARQWVSKRRIWARQYMRASRSAQLAIDSRLSMGNPNAVISWDSRNRCRNTGRTTRALASAVQRVISEPWCEAPVCRNPCGTTHARQIVQNRGGQLAQQPISLNLSRKEQGPLRMQTRNL